MLSDSAIVNSLDASKMQSSYQKDLPDSLALRYFFNNKKEELYATTEAYNMDENTYKTVTYKRKVNALFSKKIALQKYVICYWLEQAAYLAIYDDSKDAITDSYVFCIPTDVGEYFTHSILFANNSIFTIETKEQTRLKLIDIDATTGKFVVRKNTLSDSYMVIEDVNPKNEKYKRALSLLGITQDGQLR
jgi:hypothetical protein